MLDEHDVRGRRAAAAAAGVGGERGARHEPTGERRQASMEVSILTSPEVREAKSSH